MNSAKISLLYNFLSSLLLSSFVNIQLNIYMHLHLHVGKLLDGNTKVKANTHISGLTMWYVINLIIYIIFNILREIKLNAFVTNSTLCAMYRKAISCDTYDTIKAAGISAGTFTEAKRVPFPLVGETASDLFATYGFALDADRSWSGKD